MVMHRQYWVTHCQRWVILRQQLVTRAFLNEAWAEGNYTWEIVDEAWARTNEGWEIAFERVKLHKNAVTAIITTQHPI